MALNGLLFLFTHCLKKATAVQRFVRSEQDVQDVPRVLLGICFKDKLKAEKNLTSIELKSGVELVSTHAQGEKLVRLTSLI